MSKEGYMHLSVFSGKETNKSFFIVSYKLPLFALEYTKEENEGILSIRNIVSGSYFNVGFI
jgi:hypothetical protein